MKRLILQLWILCFSNHAVVISLKSFFIFTQTPPSQVSSWSNWRHLKNHKERINISRNKHALKSYGAVFFCKDILWAVLLNCSTVQGKKVKNISPMAILIFEVKHNLIFQNTLPNFCNFTTLCRLQGPQLLTFASSQKPLCKIKHIMKYHTI